MTVSRSKLNYIKKYGEQTRTAFVRGSKSKSLQMRTILYKLRSALKKKDRSDFTATLFPVAATAGVSMPDFLIEYQDNDEDYKACAYAFLIGLSTPEEFEKAQEDNKKRVEKMSKKIYTNRHGQGENEVWFKEEELRTYFLPYNADNGDVLDVDVDTSELIEQINKDSNLYEIVEE
ncbi:hypothetical protein HCA69_12545 [Listeria grandensis]|uniref:Uncharacterized protein n=1 Tax=Listeria grandensis TaxID=1494963 RepID=A0A7X0Y6B5_9LIST|nr:hypothetical protein [Listeria grandensis]MBC1937202.1 hypothetical protein [Listeria grandensis]